MFPLMLMLFVPLLTVSFIQWLYQKLFMTPYDVKGKVVLVTGASGGLGEACSKRFALSGAKVVLCARNANELNRVKEEITAKGTLHEAVVHCMDVTVPEDVVKVVQKVEEEVGPVDVLISNAGMSQRGSVEDCLIDVHHSLININYFGQVNVVKAVLPSMLRNKQGHIVSIGTVQGQIAIPFRSAYAGSKHASQAFFDSLRAEVAANNVNVTVVNPGYIRTNLSKNAVSSDGSKHGVLDATTASGMSPSFVANHVFDSVEYYTREVTLCDIKSNIAMYLRTIFPFIYFKLMEMRAKSERKKMSKEK